MVKCVAITLECTTISQQVYTKEQDPTVGFSIKVPLFHLNIYNYNVLISWHFGRDPRQAFRG